MKCWDILEIPYGSDLKTIKKAYAKLLKVYNPEDDAKGYQRLREAYDEAVKCAKRNNKSQNIQEDNYNNSIESISDEVYINKNEANIAEGYSNVHITTSLNSSINHNYDEKQNDNINLNEEVNKFLNRLKEIYNDISLRIDPKVWKELLTFNVVWNVYSFEIIEEKIFEFIINHKYLPSEVWSLLDENFKWTENEIKLYDKYPTEKVKEFFKNLRNANKLKYDYLGLLNSELADKYLFFRERASELLYKRDYYEAQKNLFAAYDIFKEDPELLRLIGTLYHDNGDFNKALEFLKLAFDRNSYDIDSALLIGGILGADGRFSEALSYFELYLSFNNDDELALNNIGYCYYYTNNLIMARESFQRYIDIYGNNKRIINYLKNIELKLQGKTVKTIKFKKYKPRKKKIVPKKLKKSKTKGSDIEGRFRNIVIFMILAAIFVSLSVKYQYKNTTTDNPNEHKTFNELASSKEFEELDYRTNVDIYLNNVKPIGYYKISEPLDNKIIFSESKIKQKGLGDKVEAQIYLGEFQGLVVPFADSNCSTETIDENGGYKIKGSKCFFNVEQSRTINTEYSSYYDSNYSFGVGEYIDASQTEIDIAKRGAQLIKKKGNNKIKFIETMQDFKDTRFSGRHSVNLTNIIPLDLYYVKYDENKSAGYFNKKEMDEKNLWGETCIQAYSGTLDTLNIMFLDPKFQRNSVKSDGSYTVQGYVYGIYDKFKCTKTEEGQKVNTVNLYDCYIDNTK